MEPPYRTIIESERFRNELTALVPTTRAADDFIDTAKWLLPWNPWAGYQLVPSKVWFLPIAELAGRAALYYAFDDENVVFLSIKALP